MAIINTNASVKAETFFPDWFNAFSDGLENVDSAEELYNSVALYRQCLKLRCDAISGVPYVLTDKRGEEVLWSDLFPGQSLASLIWKTEAAFLLTGKAFWEIGRNAFGKAGALRFINPYAVNIQYTNWVLRFHDMNSGAVFYNDTLNRTYQVVYFAEYNPRDDLMPGKGDAQVAGVSAMLMREIIRYPESYLSGGAMPVTLLGVKDAAPGETERVASWVRTAGSRFGSFWQRILGIEAGSVVPQTLTPPVKDLDLSALRDLAWQDIIAAFGVPDSMVRSSAANYATAVNDRKSFYEDRVKPRAEKFADVINEQLLKPMGHDLRFEVEKLSLFQDDQESRLAAFTALREGGYPIVMASDVVGIELTQDQRDELETYIDETPTITTPPPSSRKSEIQEELERWQRMAEKRVKAGKAIRAFESEVIPLSLKASIEGALDKAQTVDDVKSVFAFAAEWEDYP